MFRARQSKRREMVVFDERAVYPQYAILFYEYESEEAMKENIKNEFPQNRHGLEDADPLHFILRDVDFGSPDQPRIPSDIPPPDPVPDEQDDEEEENKKNKEKEKDDDDDDGEDEEDEKPPGSFTFNQF